MYRARLGDRPSRILALSLGFLAADTRHGAADRPATPGSFDAPRRPRLHLASDPPM